MMKKKQSKRNRERFWREIISKQADSGQSVQIFCQKRQLSESTFYFWQKKLKQRCPEQAVTGTVMLQQADGQQPSTQLDQQESEPDQAPHSPLGEDDPTSSAPAIKERSATNSVSAIVREERYRLTDSTAVRVEIEADFDGAGTKLDAELVDISQGGVRLRSNTPVAEKDSLTIAIVPKGLSDSLSVRARVCWTTLAPKGRFWLGCSIEPRIPLALLEHLAANGILERRYDVRQEISVILSGCWELDPTEFKVSLLNISQGGICLSISQKGRPGDRIRLTLPDNHQRPCYVLTTVCWQIGTDDGYVVGCRFCHPTGYEKLMQFADAQDVKVMSKSSA